MIDNRVERGTFFHPRQRIVVTGDDIKFIYPISGAELAMMHDIGPLEGVDPELWKEISLRAEGDFTRQVKIKLGIVAADAYF
ncbi:MAG TPA: hypothetical protein PK228_20250 [Saprospiraceae bacterium]|nr:hypothetical protein [Saprospiraceae bacterium]